MAEGDRWDEIFNQSGLSATDLAQTKTPPPTQRFSRSYETRKVADSTFKPNCRCWSPVVRSKTPDDIARVLHHRINRYMNEVGYPAQSANDLVAGIFPRPTGITDPMLNRHLTIVPTPSNSELASSP